ncbi:hypothetical protein [Cupriavidus cauae]|uniref:Sulfotransferase family protein n=1 Tax=Cupriavidus cauae TaxID=2608999 RepID=A0A5M8BE81_9BURK|nr:hypothetical protein [Cupriavidus cauae]KAA6133382.1 hypothetical protein F1599_00765 [Cupriavidus cauae]
MNKILIVGHPSSRFTHVEQLLKEFGMATPRPSRRENLTPAEIGSLLYKAHGVNPLQRSYTGGELTLVNPGPIWQGMVLDLLLANLDQRLWGWADPLALQLLDFWKLLDPTVGFVLVYDDPETAFDVPIDENDYIQNLPLMIEEWCSYNDALLAFYKANKERSILVHAKEVRSSAAWCLQEVRIRLDAPLAPFSRNFSDDRYPFGETVTAPLVEKSKIPAESTWSVNALDRYIIGETLQLYPRALELFSELQSAATLPSSAPAKNVDPLVAWQELKALQVQITSLGAENKAHKEQIASLYSLQSTIDALNGDLKASKAREYENLRELEKLQNLSSELNAISARSKSDLQMLQQEKDRIESKLTDQVRFLEKRLEEKESIEAENTRLLAQLHIVQQELERKYADVERLKNAGAASAKLVGAADRVKNHLSYRLGAAMIAGSRSFGGWLAMPWTLVKVVRCYKQDQNQRSQKKLPPIHKYSDAHEAERVKRHLSYRLGHAVLERARSPLGWLAMPFAICSEIKEFRTERRA